MFVAAIPAQIFVAAIPAQLNVCYRKATPAQVFVAAIPVRMFALVVSIQMVARITIRE